MQKVNFAYTTEVIGVFENDGPDLTEAEIIKAIEEDYPEAIDIEIVSVET
jgi:hypothetical protein